MEFAHTIIEVDGTIQNPFVLAGLITWTPFLTLITFLAIIKLSPDRNSGPRSFVPLGLFLLPFYVATPFAHRFISSVFYCVFAGKLLRVGYWGDAPFWVSWLTALLGGCVAFLGRRKGPT